MDALVLRGRRSRAPWPGRPRRGVVVENPAATPGSTDRARGAQLRQAALVLPTVFFLLLRSAIGFPRRRLQREPWRRDVERLS
jgi:hypothetical protein